MSKRGKKARQRAKREAQLAAQIGQTASRSTDQQSLTRQATPQRPSRSSAPTTPDEPYVRDAVTGECVPLTRLHESLVMVVRDQDVRLDRDWITDEPRGLTAIPLALHTRQQDGRMGKRYTRQFAAYLPKYPSAVAEAYREADRDDVWWWRVEYAVNRVRRGFLARWGPLRGQRNFTAVMQRLRDDVPIQVVAARFTQTTGWVAYLCGFAHVLAHRRESFSRQEVQPAAHGAQSPDQTDQGDAAAPDANNNSGAPALGDEPRPRPAAPL